MPPKAKGKGNDKGGSSKEKVDKTFGMKNKKGKAVAAKFQTGPGQQHGRQTDYVAKKKNDELMAQKALESLLFQEAVKKKKKEEKKKEEEKKIEEEPVPTELEAFIEYQRARLKTRTPVTLERLRGWLKAKEDKRDAEMEAKMGSAKAELARGKRVQSLTGKELFSVEPTLFVDDEAAAVDRLEDRHLSLEELEEEGEDGAACSRLFVGMKVKALYMGGGSQWFDATIRAYNADGTYDLEFDDGECEGQVKREHIEEITESESDDDEEEEEAAAGVAAVNLADVDEDLFAGEDDDLPDD